MNADGEKAGDKAPRTTAVHAGETIGPGLLAKILRDSDISREQLELLQ